VAIAMRSTCSFSRRVLSGVMVAVGVSLATCSATAAEPAPPADAALRDHVPRPGTFPPPAAGSDMGGELITYDPITRIGTLRRDGDFVHRDVVFRFALLPYAEVYFHGSPAELQDVPPGTRLRGRFLLPPEGDTRIPAPAAADKDTPRHNHALILEDDFSHAARRGAAWKVTGIDLAHIKSVPYKGVLSVESTAVGSDGKPEVLKLDVSRASRIWEAGGGLAELEALAPGQIVQLNLDWAPDWKNRGFHCIDIWLDEESQRAATERQRRVHVRKLFYFWPAGWIDHVEHQPGGSGIVTLTVFGGIDKEIEEALRWMVGRADQKGWFVVAPADGNLMTWRQDDDKVRATLLEIRDVPDPPLGHSGLQLRVQIEHPLVDGFRPGRFVRVRPNMWPVNINVPGERRSKWNRLEADAGFLLDGRPESAAAEKSTQQVTGGGRN